jgi:hypothetical protein
MSFETMFRRLILGELPHYGTLSADSHVALTHKKRKGRVKPPKRDPRPKAGTVPIPPHRYIVSDRVRKSGALKFKAAQK